MARTRGPVSTLLFLSALFCAGAVVFWTRWVWTAPPESYAGLHLMLGLMLLLGLALLGTGVAASLAMVLAARKRTAQRSSNRILPARQ